MLPASIPACRWDWKFSTNENILTLSQKCLNIANASPCLPDWTWPPYSRRAQPCPQVPPCTSSSRMIILEQGNGYAIPIFLFLKLENSFYWHFDEVKTLSGKMVPEKHWNDHILKTWMQWIVPTFPSCFPSSVRMSTQVSESEGISKNNKSILPPTSTTGSTIIGTKASDSPVQWGVPVHWKHME